MTRNTLKILAALFFILLLQSGCAMHRSSHDDQTQAITARVLVKSTNSWNGEPLPAYSQGQPEITASPQARSSTRIATRS